MHVELNIENGVELEGLWLGREARDGPSSITLDPKGQTNFLIDENFTCCHTWHQVDHI